MSKLLEKIDVIFLPFINTFLIFIDFEYFAVVLTLVLGTYIHILVQ